MWSELFLQDAAHQTKAVLTTRLNSDPEKTQKIPEFMLLSLNQIDTEALVALQMIFVTARLH